MQAFSVLLRVSDAKTPEVATALSLVQHSLDLKPQEREIS